MLTLFVGLNKSSLCHEVRSAEVRSVVLWVDDPIGEMPLKCIHQNVDN